QRKQHQQGLMVLLLQPVVLGLRRLNRRWLLWAKAARPRHSAPPLYQTITKVKAKRRRTAAQANAKARRAVRCGKACRRANGCIYLAGTRGCCLVRPYLVVCYLCLVLCHLSFIVL